MAIRAVQAGPKVSGGGSGPAHFQIDGPPLTAATTEIASPVASPNAKDQLSVIVIQDATGGRQITWDASFSAATTVEIATVPNKESRFHFIARADNKWHLFSGPMFDL